MSKPLQIMSHHPGHLIWETDAPLKPFTKMFFNAIPENRLTRAREGLREPVQASGWVNGWMGHSSKPLVPHAEIFLSLLKTINSKRKAKPLEPSVYAGCSLNQSHLIC